MPNLMMSWQHGAELAAAFAVVGAGLRLGLRDSPRSRLASAFAIEASIIAALYTVWQLAGSLSIMGSSDALARGAWIDRFEHTLHLPSERSVQGLVIGHPIIVQGMNLYYASMHFGILFVFLLWLFLRHRDAYGGVRTTLAISTLVCLAISFIPVAPPRVLGGGIVDTAAQYGQSVYGGALSADQLAAMPSVHVLWAVTIGWYAVKIGRSRWRFLAPGHTVLTVFVVVATGNHWWLDGIVAVMVLVACVWAQYGIARAWHALHPARPAAEPTTPGLEPAPTPTAAGSPTTAESPTAESPVG
ncbi:MAG TPA: phosphatase PAP2 family protein [Micromonosporaceae bacterium]